MGYISGAIVATLKVRVVLKSRGLQFSKMVLDLKIGQLEVPQNKLLKFGHIFYNFFQFWAVCALFDREKPWLAVLQV